MSNVEFGGGDGGRECVRVGQVFAMRQVVEKAFDGKKCTFCL